MLLRSFEHFWSHRVRTLLYSCRDSSDNSLFPMWPSVAPNIHELSESGPFWYPSSRRSILKYREEMLEISLAHFLKFFFVWPFWFGECFCWKTFEETEHVTCSLKKGNSHKRIHFEGFHVGFAVLRICYQVTSSPPKFPWTHERYLPSKIKNAQPPRKGHFKTRHELLQIKGLGPKSALNTMVWVGMAGWVGLVCSGEVSA